MTIESVRQDHEESIMRLPNVTGIGIGKQGDKDVITVFVTRKVPESALQPHEIIPKEIEGYPIEVEEIGTVTIQTR